MLYVNLWPNRGFLKVLSDRGESGLDTLYESTTTTFTCFVDGSWKNDDHTSEVRWVLELQVGTMDLLVSRGSKAVTKAPLDM